MKRLIFLLSLPYVVTVTDLGNNCMDGVVWEGHGLSGDHHKCQDWEDFKNYHLPGFQDCVSSSTAQCDYLYDIASDLNRAHEKGYEIIETTQTIPVSDPRPAKIICHKLVGGMMESMPCEDSK